MTSRDYESEALLQELLGKYPDLLAGAQMNRDAPRRWILVRREMGVPALDGRGAQWAVDHLFIDQDGVPTIVEVKRASDTRIRREVVGQMLDYAANGVRYWPLEDLRREFDTRCVERGADQNATLAEQLGVDDPEEFWSKVRQNLEVGRVRLVFVADTIPVELQTIIEFLNDQLQRCQVVGLEVQQFVSPDGLRTLAPRVVGETAQARVAKGRAGVASYADQFRAATQETQELERRLLGWCERNRYRSFVSKSARQFDAENGTRLFLLYPGGNYVEFRLSTVQRVGMEVEAREIVDSLTRYAGSVRTSAAPRVSCAALLRAWDDFESAFLPRYVAIRKAAYARR